jgi:hypothetical protein
MVIWLLEIQSVCKERTCGAAYSLTRQNSPHSPAPTLISQTRLRRVWEMTLRAPYLGARTGSLRSFSVSLPPCLLASLLHFLSVFAPNCGVQTVESRLFRYSHGRPLRMPYGYPPPRPRSNDKTLRLPHRKPTVAEPLNPHALLLRVSLVTRH